MNIDELKSLCREKGVVGAGGAGFPTYEKFNGIIDTVIINACECEPLLKVDINLIENYSREILKGIDVVVKTLRVKKAIIGIKEYNQRAIISLNNEITNFENIEINEIENVYPSGDEVYLINECTGIVVPEGKLPKDVNCLVLNIETVYNIFNAVFRGNAVTEKFVTITGAVKHPQTIKVPIGAKLTDIMNIAKPSVKDYEIIMGGPMTGSIVSNNDVITKTTKGIIVLESTHPLISSKKCNSRNLLKRISSTCSSCQKCTDLCPRNLLGYSIKPHEIMRSLSYGIVNNIDIYKGAMSCSECGVCEVFSCHQNLSPRTIIKDLKIRLRENGIKNDNCNKAVLGEREYRKIPSPRLYSRLQLTQYNVENPFVQRDFHLKEVRIKFKQHIGAKAKPVIGLYEEVKKGQLIAKVEELELGAYIHSSISGVVIDITENDITVVSRGENNE